MESQQNVSDLKPAYTSYKSFKTSLEEFSDSVVPSDIDPSLFPKKSGALISALRKAYEFLGCTDAKGRTQQVLRDLVAAVRHEDEWPRVLGPMITDRYADIIGDLDLVSGTARQLDQRFSQTAISGDTKRKAIRFYLDALKDAKIKHSSHFKPPKSQPSTNRRNRTSDQVGEETDTSTEDTDTSRTDVDNGASKDPDVPDGYTKLDVQVPGRDYPYSIVLPNNTTSVEWEFVRNYVDGWHKLKEKMQSPKDEEKAEPEQDDSGSA